MKLDWNKLTPRERDALIAKKVMGYEDNRPTGRPGEMYGINDWYAPGKAVWMLDVPEYTTDIKAAWEIVEKLKTNDDDLFELHRDKGEWICSFFCNEAFRVNHPAEAICLAALHYVEIEI